MNEGHEDHQMCIVKESERDDTKDFSFGYSGYGNTLNKVRTYGEEQEFFKRIINLFLGMLNELET